MNKLPVLLTYPASTGDLGRYTEEEMRKYFSKFPGGVAAIVTTALEQRIRGGLLEYHDATEVMFDACVEPISGLITADIYSREKREFYRHCFDIWRYVATATREADLNGMEIAQAVPSKNLDRVTFLLK